MERRRILSRFRSMAGDYRSRGCFAHRSDLLLEPGKACVSVQFVDEDMLIPIMKTWVFAARNLDPEDAENHLILSGCRIVPARNPLHLCDC